VRGGVLVSHRDPANRDVEINLHAQHCKALARSTGAAISQGLETATTLERRVLERWSFLPQKRLRNEDQGVAGLGSNPTP